MSVAKLNNKNEIDIAKLVDSRLLIQANSGGGKSWCIRRLLEQSHGKVQQIVIDLEGEFSTLREHYDYILAGKGGDTPADPRSAGLLAKKLLELGVSAIIDLYELQHQERKRFVRLFLESMVNAPKELWHPVLVVIDEAHIFAPEKGQSEAMDAVIDLATRGRKRGYCAVLATQRLSKLHKDAAAECNNKMIGRTGLDIDMKRAGEELGFTSKEQIRSLRMLEPGEFYVFGPAISNTVEKIKIGSVKTTHPKAGSRILTKTVPPTEKIKKVLGQLDDLSEEAEKEAKTVVEMKQQIVSLKRDVRQFSGAKADPKVIEAATAKAVAEAERRKDLEFHKERGKWQRQIKNFFRIFEQIGKLVKGTVLENRVALPKIVKPLPKAAPRQHIIEEEVDRVASPGDDEITNPQQRVLDAIAWMNAIGVDEPEKVAVAFVSGYTYGAGSFNNACGALRSIGLIEYRGKNIVLTETGHDFAEEQEPPLSNDELHERIYDRLKGPQEKLLRVLIAAYPQAVLNEELADASGYTANAGSFNNARGRLRSLGLVEYPQPGYIVARDILFPL